MKITTPTERVLNACWRLNAESYETQVIANRMRPLKQFTPCAKAEALMEVIRKGKHFGEAHMMAEYVSCPCHSKLTPAQLMDYEYDETYKLASYNGDKKTLYPRIWKGN